MEISTHAIVPVCYPISSFEFQVSASDVQSRYFLVPMLCVGMHIGRLCLPFCESQSPYDPHTCMYPKIEAEPLRTHSQAEPGNERFSKLSRLMSMAEISTHAIVPVCYPISSFEFQVSASDFQSRYLAFKPILHSTQQKSVNW